MDFRNQFPLHSRQFSLLPIVLATLLATMCAASSGVAQSPDLTAEVQSQLAAMQQQIDDLKANGLILPDAYAPAPVVESPVVECCPPAKPAANFPTAKLGGFFQADLIYFGQDANNIAAVGDVQDGADFRRARLAATGQAWDNVSYMLEMDFAFPGRPSFMDVWLEVDDVIGSSNLRIGQFRQPFGMDGLTSVKEMTFLEPGLPFAFLPFRQIGAMLHGSRKDELATWAISGFRYPTDTFGGNVGDNGGYGMASRLTGLLVNRDDGGGLLHIGGGVPAGVPGSVPPFVDTGAFAATNANLLSAELAMAYGSFYAQSEAIYALVDQAGGSSVTLPGAYVQAGYFLTGETRAYNGKNGVFGRVNPIRSVGKDGGIGAWEIAGRYSYLDLNDDNIQGGRLTDLTAGLNWYLNPHTKFQFNYIRAMLDKSTGPGVGDSDANIYAVRAQVDF